METHNRRKLFDDSDEGEDVEKKETRNLNDYLFKLHYSC
jgi:hypothetical protein